MIQNWAVSFESKPIVKYTNEVYKTLQKEGLWNERMRHAIFDLPVSLGYSFPPMDPATMSAAMTDTLAVSHSACDNTLPLAHIYLPSPPNGWSQISACDVGPHFRLRIGSTTVVVVV